MIRIKRRYQLEDALEELGSHVYTGNKDKVYKYMPWWFCFDGDNIFIYSLDNLPDELMDCLKTIHKNDSSFIKNEEDVLRIPTTKRMNIRMGKK